MDVVEILIVCAVGLILIGAIVGATTVRQVRSFAAKVREDERRQSEEHEENESGAKV